MLCMCLQVPFTFKYAVDALAADPSGATLCASPLLPMLPATMLAAYGVARIASSACNELRSAVFAKVGFRQHAQRLRLHLAEHTWHVRTAVALPIGAQGLRPSWQPRPSLPEATAF